jgi:RNA recognition motif-containing protein
MVDWPDDDHRIFVGNLGNEVKDEDLTMAFKKYPSFLKAKVIREKKSGKSKGFGFVSIGNPDDYIKAMKEMNGEYLGKRPLRLTKSDWKKRFTPQPN